MNHVIILANGIGSRAGLSIPKQYYEVKGKPILVYTIEKFQSTPEIDDICIVCSKEWHKKVREYVAKFSLTKVICIVEGGENGLISAFNGLKHFLYVPDNDLILVHDGVRPFVDGSIIKNNIDIANKYGNAMSAVSCVETLVHTNDGVYSEECIPRDGIKRIQTPQTFRKGDLLRLLESESLQNCSHPSLFSLWMSRGFGVYCSIGNEKNIKITYPEDISYFYSLFG